MGHQCCCLGVCRTPSRRRTQCSLTVRIRTRCIACRRTYHTNLASSSCRTHSSFFDQIEKGGGCPKSVLELAWWQYRGRTGSGMPVFFFRSHPQA
jgi:hypothetical protein